MEKNKELSNKIHLITYADSLGGDLKNLKLVLDKYFKKEIVGVHILPFYPSTSDRGFSPVTYETVDPKFGTWKDIREISQNYELTCDLMVNHISSQSEQFQDFLKKGDDSEYVDWFVGAEKFSRRIEGGIRRKINGRILSLLEKVMNKFRSLDVFFHKYGVNKLALKRIFRPRAGSPFIEFEINGKKKNIWCTFSADQIDLDIRNSGVTEMLKESIERLAFYGAKMVRLDAVGYISKKRGTSNFLIPESYEYIKELSDTCHQNGAKTLPEIRHHYKIQVDLANRPGVDRVYDFCFPTLLLSAFLRADNKHLRWWIKNRPQNSINVLDTHDGIGIVDVRGILSEKEIEEVVKELKIKGANLLMRSLGQKAQENEIYQVNSTFFEALGKNDDAYIAARAFQFFLPGIQQIYYVGLLAGNNDYEKFCKSEVGRDLNRHDYSLSEIENEIKKDVVKRLLKLIRFRNEYPAFSGDFKMLKSKKHLIVLRWKKGNFFCEARIDLKKKKSSIAYFDKKQGKNLKYVP